MNKFAVATLIFIATCGMSVAEEPVRIVPMEQWLKETNASMLEHQKIIVFYKQRQISACVLPTEEKRTACNAAYALLIARRNAIIAHYQLRLASVKLDGASQELVIHKISVVPEIDREQISVNDAWKFVWQMFPDPNYKEK